MRQTFRRERIAALGRFIRNAAYLGKSFPALSDLKALSVRTCLRRERLPAYLPGRDETKVSFAIRIPSRRVIATKVFATVIEASILRRRNASFNPEIQKCGAKSKIFKRPRQPCSIVVSCNVKNSDWHFRCRAKWI